MLMEVDPAGERRGFGWHLLACTLDETDAASERRGFGWHLLTCTLDAINRVATRRGLREDGWWVNTTQERREGSGKRVGRRTLDAGERRGFGEEGWQENT